MDLNPHYFVKIEKVYNWLRQKLNLLIEKKMVLRPVLYIVASLNLRYITNPNGNYLWNYLFSSSPLHHDANIPILNSQHLL